MKKLDNLDEILQRLIAADEGLSQILDNDKKISLILIGGSAMIIKGLLSRVTLDIDTYTITESNAKKFLEDFDINDRAASIMNICDDFEQRLEKVTIDFNHLEVYILGNEDIIISKLGTGRPKDIADLVNSKIYEKVDLEFVGELIRSNCFIGDRVWKDYEYLKSFKNGGL